MHKNDREEPLLSQLRKANNFGIRYSFLRTEMTSCPICKSKIEGNLGQHIKNAHGEADFKKAVLRAKERGIPDYEIGEMFNITFKQLEKIITEAYGINISILKKPKKPKYWEPKDFKQERTTVWSFPKRGDWATHDCRYRGNWSPYIPRNVILKYSQPGEVVLDYFVGGGTTAVEAKLLGRRCIAIDINPAAVGLTRENLKFSLPENIAKWPIYEPEVKVGDARDLKKLGIEDNTIDLICAHPPYAGIIDYSSKIEGDLSKLSIEEFLTEMGKVAQESLRVLKPGRKCAILIGDTRKRKHVVPIGFKTINVFLDIGFKLKELVIKRQHNCKTTGFWYEKSVKYNFLLLAHEYLPIFEKPSSPIQQESSGPAGKVNWVITKPPYEKLGELESTTVWIFPKNVLEKRLNGNVFARYSGNGDSLTISFTTEGKGDGKEPVPEDVKLGLLFLKAPFLDASPSRSIVEGYLSQLKEIVGKFVPYMNEKSYLVVQTRDVRIDGYLEPLGKRVVDLLENESNLWLKEIVIVTPEEQDAAEKGEELEITHQYLLVYEVMRRCPSRK